MALDVHKPKNYRRGWRGEDAAKHLKPHWTITVCDACHRAACWQGEFYCDRYKSAGTVEITVKRARELNIENPTYWLKDESIKARLVHGLTNPKDDLIQRLRFVQSQGGGYYELAQDCIDLIESMAAVGLRQETEIERLRATLLWIASMADEDNEWDGVDRFRTARQKAIDAVGPAAEPSEPRHTTEENFQHFLAYSNLKVDEHALRWAFYAGKGEPPPGKSDVLAPEVCGCPYGQCHCDDGSERCERFLLESKRKHYVCEDCWYSCPESGECCDEREKECNCGAAE